MSVCAPFGFFTMVLLRKGVLDLMGFGTVGRWSVSLSFSVGVDYEAVLLAVPKAMAHAFTKFQVFISARSYSCRKGHLGT